MCIFHHCLIFVLFIAKFTSPSRFFDVPEIKIEKWISSSVWDLEEQFEQWNFDLKSIPPNALKTTEDESTIIVSQHISGLGIVCNASYPVEWVFEQVEHNDEDAFDIIMKTSRESNDVSNSRNDRFIAILELFGDQRTVTGNYSCRSTDSYVGVERNIFVFWDGSSPPYLVLSGRTVHIYRESNTTAVLPCYVSQPNIDVTLFNEVNGTFYKMLEGAGVQFLPSVGFVINFLKASIPNIYGRYKCVTDVEEDEVNIILERGARPQKKLPNIISPGTRLYYDPESQELVCCTRNGQAAPSLHNIFCINPSICKMKEHKLFKVGNNGKKIINGSCTSDKIFTRDYGIFRCKGEGIDVSRTFYTDFGPLYNDPQGVYFDFRRIIPSRMMHLVIHDAAPYYHRQSISVTCEVMNSYFSDGHKWAILWKNNSIIPFQPYEFIDDPKIHGVRFVDVELHWKMSELICYAPVWNTSEWVSRSVKLDVQKSSFPAFESPQREQVQFVYNDTEKILECKCMGHPSPTIIWKKNEEDVVPSMVILNTNGTSLLIFHRVTHETAAEYKCIAKNILGEASKIIRVIVEDKPLGTSAWGTTAAVLVPLLIIALIITAGVYVWKMQLQKKIVNHLNRVVFRDVERQQEYSA